MDLSRYQMTGEEGGEGIVYLRNKATGHHVVLKRARLERGLREVRAYRKLSSSALVDFAIEPEGVLMLLHRHRGISLAEHLESDRCVEKLIRNIDRLLFSAVQSVRSLHAEGVVHGRITPSKLIIDEGGAVRIVGLSAAGFDGADSDALSARIDDVREFELPADYFTAPEIVFRTDEDRRLSDYYSLGKCFLLLVRGREEQVSYETLENILALASVVPEARRRVLEEFTDG